MCAFVCSHFSITSQLARRGTRVGEMEYSGAPLMGDRGYSGGGKGCMARGIVVGGYFEWRYF